jgi:uncharacterized protein
MTIAQVLPILLAIFIISTIYASVGQAGASGFIAVMALFGLAATVIKPTALILNVLVSLVVMWQFRRAGFLSWKKLWPFAITSVPLAFIGGYVTLASNIFNGVLGSLLLIASLPLLLRHPQPEQGSTPPSIPLALLTGSVIGLLSGLTGMGGGILLAPMLIYCRWYDARTIAGISGAFIFLNSIVALLGLFFAGQRLPMHWVLYALAAVSGGFIGARLGSRYISVPVIHRLLGAILLLGYLTPKTKHVTKRSLRGATTGSYITRLYGRCSCQ